jgi:hypothetical protein
MCDDIDFEIGYETQINGFHFKYKPCEQFSRYFDVLTVNDQSLEILSDSPFLYTNTHIYISSYYDPTFHAMEKGYRRICRVHVHDNCKIEYLGIPQKHIEWIKLSGNRLFYYGKERKIQYLDLNNLRKGLETDTPIDFNPVTKTNNLTVEYCQLEKLPSTNLLFGSLKINGYLFLRHKWPFPLEYKFGGPFLYNESFMVIPVLKQKLWKTGFNLARIDLSDNHIHIFPIFKRMIHLESFANDTVYYYDNVDKSNLLNYSF